MRKARSEVRVKMHEPSETSAIVRMPAGRSADLRSHPITPPNKVAKVIRLPKSASRGVRYMI